MYRQRGRQISFDENPHNFMGVRLNPENRWVKLSALIPWDEIEALYEQTFANPKHGNPAKSCKMAIGSLIIKEKMGLSDMETVELITEHPYLQYFIGLSSFTDNPPFDASTMTYFRKRITPEMLSAINQMIVDAGRETEAHDDDDSDNNKSPSGGVENEPSPVEVDNRGTMILDATCAPADIRFPTDVSLLNESREKLESIIDYLHEGIGERKPRTYRQNARKAYLRFARNRRPRVKQIRQALRQQLGYVRRDLGHVDALITTSSQTLTPRQEAYYKTIQKVYQQQQEMYDKKTHKIDHRIVSIHQPWVRPIVRGKANARVEFGAKVSISMIDGYAMIERLSWEAFNETGDLQVAAERYRERHGVYPKRILADKIYRSRANLKYCKDKHIKLNGPHLGRPPKDKQLYREQKLLERQEAGERNAVEGKFGEAKRCYGLNRVMTRLKNTSEVSIHMTFLVMNLEKRRRDIYFFIFRLVFAEQLACA